MSTKVSRYVGRKVKEAREAGNMTQEELAHAIGYKQSYLSQIEAGLKRLKVTDVYKIARALSKEPAFFLPAGPAAA